MNGPQPRVPIYTSQEKSFSSYQQSHFIHHHIHANITFHICQFIQYIHIMSPTPTTDTHTPSSYGGVYSQQAAPDFKAQDQNLIALNNTALNTAASELGDDQRWAKNGLEDNNMLLGTIGRRYGNPMSGSEQETNLAQEYVLVFPMSGQG